MPSTSSVQLCVLCGARPATTVDHVPPRSIFPKPRPSDLVTVPACFHCNNSQSKYDEEFRVFVSIQIGMENHTTEKLWKHEVLPTLEHNRRLKNHIVQRSWPVEV